MNRGAWQATVHGVAKSQTQLSTHTRTYTHTYMCIPDPPRCAPEADNDCRVIYVDQLWFSEKKNFCITVCRSCFQIILVLPNYPLD